MRIKIRPAQKIIRHQPPFVKRKTAICLLAAICLFAAASVWWAGRPRRTETGAPAGKASTREAQNSAAPEGTPNAPRKETIVSISAQVGDILTRLKAGTDPAASRSLLAELRGLLDSLPRDVASREVRALLESHKDAPTLLDVTVKEGGVLGDASSFRVFLLDYLGQNDRAAAALVSREILSAPTSPDEWAVSLRNVAWADDSQDTMEYLRAKAREMISNTAWRKNPSAGFLEAFDVIVHARGFDLAPQLTELMRDHDDRTLAHAAYLTLDRLTIADAAVALAPLAAQPELMEGREQTRANFFARLDVGEASQKALLERYLLEPRRTALELQTFAGIYPNANYMISNNLLTHTATPTREELAARDSVALQVVEGWLTDPRFTALQPQLTTMRNRLRTFVRQAAAPPAR